MLTRLATRRWLVLMALFLAAWQVVAPAQATASLSHPCCDTLCDPAMTCGLTGCQVCADRALEVKPQGTLLAQVADACSPANRLLRVPTPVETIWKPPK